jgi:hypothetical protein
MNPNYKPQKTPREEVTPEYVKECFKYNPKTGVLTWKARPKSHFPTERGWHIFHASYAGKVTGCKDYKGYLVVLIGGRPYFAHRIVWAIMKGVWPSEMIDHINGVRDDNRLANLREASRGQNISNARIRKDNTTGVKGILKPVARANGGKAWRVGIRVGGKRHHIGYFNSMEEAEVAVRESRVKLHREFAHHG